MGPARVIYASIFLVNNSLDNCYNEDIKIPVVAHPNAKRPRIEEDLLGTLHIYVHEPPLENKANRAIIEALAKHFKVDRSEVELVSGAKSKNKLFTVNL